MLLKTEADSNQPAIVMTHYKIGKSKGLAVMKFGSKRYNLRKRYGCNQHESGCDY